MYTSFLFPSPSLVSSPPIVRKLSAWLLLVHRDKLECWIDFSMLTDHEFHCYC